MSSWFKHVLFKKWDSLCKLCYQFTLLDVRISYFKQSGFCLYQIQPCTTLFEHKHSSKYILLHSFLGRKKQFKLQTTNAYEKSEERLYHYDSSLNGANHHANNVYQVVQTLASFYFWKNIIMNTMSEWVIWLILLIGNWLDWEMWELFTRIVVE